MKTMQVFLILIFAISTQLCAAPQIDHRQTSFILPDNDGEAKAIAIMLRRMDVSDIRISAQGWGARLDKEPTSILENLKKNVVVVEMPSPELEAQLRANGYNLILIENLIVVDHHAYPGLDRTNPKSSLEQIAELLDIQLNRFQSAVAINDRSYIFGLMDSPLRFTDDEIRSVRQFDLRAQGYTQEEFKTAEEAFKKRVDLPELTVVTTPSSKTGYISDLFTLSHRGQIKNLVVITQNGGQIQEMNFYGSPALAKKLQQAAGGWSGGDPHRSMYWGLGMDPTKPGQDQVVFETLGISKGAVDVHKNIFPCTQAIAALAGK